MNYIKKFNILLVLIGINILPLNAQKPEKVYSVVKQIKSFDWYRTQAKLWKQEIARDSVSETAWINYYAANRMARMTDAGLWNKEKGDYFLDLKTIVSKAEKAIPETYEFYHMNVWDKGIYDIKQADFMFKAMKMYPDRMDMISNYVNYYEINRDKENMKKYCSKWFSSNEISPGILAYNYNVLSTLEDNAIIFTNGDNDTYPLWILQYAKGIKKEVSVFNVSLLQIESYRDKLFAEIKIPVFDTAKFMKTYKTEMDYPQAIIRHIIQNTDRPVYMASTMSNEYYKEFENDLYLTGLAFRYSKSDIDNTAIIRKNYEKNFLLDYIKINFTNDLSETVVTQMNMGYLPVLFKLYEHYGLSGETEKRAEVKKLAAIISAAADKETEVMPWFEK
ncbi:MAG: hypothetical protein IT271_09115 [Chitinophagales bacterium]|nr:hypothetical protein [Chitinophagales bacterium]